jgi:RNA polymerase sigma factor (sigma-70 family)
LKNPNRAFKRNPDNLVAYDQFSGGNTTQRGCLEPASDRKERHQPTGTARLRQKTTSSEETVLLRRSRLTANDERALAARIKAGDLVAHEELITANLALVLRVVRDFRRTGIPLDDLIQEGNLALIKAAQKYDPATRSTRFGTYAACWIRASLIRAVTASGSSVKGFERSHSRKLNHPQTAMENRGESTREANGSQSTQDGRISRESLDEQLFAREEPPDEDLAKEEDRSYVHTALRRLSPFEAWVIRERFGLGELAPSRLPPSPTKAGECETNLAARGRECTAVDAALESRPLTQRSRRILFHRSYMELGQDCGLSAHRVQQVEKSALDKLRGILRPRFSEVVFR